MQNRTKEVFDLLTQRVVSKKKLCARYDKKIFDLQKSFDEKKAMRLLVRIFPWLSRQGLVKGSELERWFSPDYLAQNYIFTGGSHEVFDRCALALKDSQVKGEGHSLLCLFDRSVAKVYDSSCVMGFDRSSATLYDSCGRFFDGAHGIGYGSSRLEGFDRSQLTGHNVSMLIQNDESALTLFDRAHGIEKR